MPMDTKDPFSQRFEEARAKFLDQAGAAGLTVQSHPHPLPGRDGETLAMDVVRDGPAEADAVLMISSACHGVEGFCGSAVQTALLQDAAWRDAVRASGVAVLYVHALNPHGFSWWRRTTHENVDLNRNFVDFSQPLPANDGYDILADAIVPPEWPPIEANEAALHRYAAEHGLPGLQRALTGGQYRHPNGIFYGGQAPTWSHLTLRKVLQTHATTCKRLGWIDLHTGLGPSGVGERIFACRDDAAALARARDWWGDQVTSLYDGSSSSAPLKGLMWDALYEECTQADYTGIALEYGTLPILEMIAALRADQWLENHPEVSEPTRQELKRQIRDAFYVDTPVWKARILEQAMDAAFSGLRGLASG